MIPDVQILAPDGSRGELLALGFERSGFTTAVERSLAGLLKAYRSARPKVLVCDDATSLAALVEHLEAELASEPVPVVAVAERGARKEGLYLLGAPTYLQDVVMLGKLAVRAGRRVQLQHGETLLMARALASCGATGVLRLRRRGAGWTRRGELRISDGEFAGARAGEATGRRAFLRLCSWQAAEADFLVKPIDRTNQFGEGSRALVERAATHFAEWEKQLELAAPETYILDVDAEGLLGHLKELPDEVNSVVRLCDGTRSLATVVEESHYRDLDTLMILGKLIGLGVVTARPPAPLEEDSVHGDSRGVQAITAEMIEDAERAARAAVARRDTAYERVDLDDDEEEEEDDEDDDDERSAAPVPAPAPAPAAPRPAVREATAVGPAPSIGPEHKPTGPTLVVPPALGPEHVQTGPTTMTAPPEADGDGEAQPLVLGPGAKAKPKPKLSLDLLGAGLERVFGERPPEHDDDYDDAEPFLPPEPQQGSDVDGLSGEFALKWLEEGILRALGAEGEAESDLAAQSERTLREMPAVVLDASLFGDEGPSAVAPTPLVSPVRRAGRPEAAAPAPATAPSRPPAGARPAVPPVPPVPRPLPPPAAKPAKASPPPPPPPPPPAAPPPPPPAFATAVARVQLKRGAPPERPERSIDVELAPTPPKLDATELKASRGILNAPPAGDFIAPDEAERLRVAAPPRRVAMQPIKLPPSGAPAAPVPPSQRPPPAPPPPAPGQEPSFVTMEKQFFAEGEKRKDERVDEDSFSDLSKAKKPKK